MKSRNTRHTHQHMNIYIEMQQSINQFNICCLHEWNIIIPDEVWETRWYEWDFTCRSCMRLSVIRIMGWNVGWWEWMWRKGQQGGNPVGLRENLWEYKLDINKAWTKRQGGRWVNLTPATHAEQNKHLIKEDKGQEHPGSGSYPGP